MILLKCPMCLLKILNSTSGRPKKRIRAWLQDTASFDSSDHEGSLWLKAADDWELIGPDAAGQNIDARAFIYFLIRANKSAEEWASLDFIKIAREFGAKSHKNDVIEEIDECMRLARRDKLHNEFKKMFKRMKKK